VFGAVARVRLVVFQLGIGAEAQASTSERIREMNWFFASGGRHSLDLIGVRRWVGERE